MDSITAEEAFNSLFEPDPPTQKQLQAIHNMASALEMKLPPIETKREAGDMISKLKKIIENNVAVTGYVNPNNSSLWNEDDRDIEDCFKNY